MKHIGRYKICGLLGRGGMGKVFKIQMPVINKIAALKVLDPNPVLVNLMGAENLRRLFISEALKMAQLKHPNIVQIWNFDEIDDKLFYVMDYYCNNLGMIIGETYQTDMPSRIIKVDRAIDYTRQILLGLARLHHAGIIHRDIKPFNILLTDQDVVKICDFGLSKLRGETFKGPSNLNVGSPWYAAPEQEINPDEVDFSADLYSTGVILYRMLAGALPPEKPDQTRNINPDLDENWDAFFTKSIAQDPKQRFDSAGDMLRSLEQLDIAWKDKIAQICQLPPSESLTENSKSEIHPDLPRITLRNQGQKVRPGQAGKIFSTDTLWRPSVYVQNHFIKFGPDTVADHATGLVWQQSGSQYPLTWREAHDYIKRLNQNEFQGHHDWRLPTIDELMSLLVETPYGEDFCMEPIFDPTQKWLWSCDRRSYMAAWCTNMEMGYVFWQDFTCNFYVKAVRTLLQQVSFIG
jgi:serine/threonine protein kinase